jgi:hypothetical protein
LGSIPDPTSKVRSWPKTKPIRKCWTGQLSHHSDNRGVVISELRAESAAEVHQPGNTPTIEAQPGAGPFISTESCCYGKSESSYRVGLLLFFKYMRYLDSGLASCMVPVCCCGHTGECGRSHGTTCNLSTSIQLRTRRSLVAERVEYLWGRQTPMRTTATGLAPPHGISQVRLFRRSGKRKERLVCSRLGASKCL